MMDALKGLGKLAVLAVIATVVAVIAITAIQTIVSIMKHAQDKAGGGGSAAQPVYQGAEDLKNEIRNNKIVDPYDERWWGKSITKAQKDAIERAFDAWLADTEADGAKVAELEDAVRRAGISVTNFPDAVHAANHILNHGETKILVTPDTPAGEGGGE